MQDQWFLDLDGVRSGPYQTSEVLSLVADGEVLPHHLISTELKSKEWTSILDWRLKHGKSSTPATVTEKKTAPSPIEIEKPAPAPAPTPTPTPVPTSATSPVPVLEQKTTEPAATTKGKRDPMAEMFDMLQKAKHKREQKSHQESTLHPPMDLTNKGNSSITRFVVICVLVTVIGFFLGQWFQKQTSKDNPADAGVKATTGTTTPTANPVVTTPPAMPSPSKPEIIDRSNEKMTIRSQPPARVDGFKAGAPHDLPKERNTNNEKDHEMIEDLKKELSELKALKEESRAAESESELPSPSPEMPENIAPGSEGASANPANPANPNDVHY